jgi:hypothetical protein
MMVPVEFASTSIEIFQHDTLDCQQLVSLLSAAAGTFFVAVDDESQPSK